MVERGKLRNLHSEAVSFNFFCYLFFCKLNAQFRTLGIELPKTVIFTESYSISSNQWVQSYSFLKGIAREHFLLNYETQHVLL